MDIAAMITKLFVKNGMIFAFMLLGIIMFVAYKLGGLTKGRVHGSAIAIFLGLVLAYIGGVTTGGSKGIADVPLFCRHGSGRRRHVQRFRHRFHRLRCRPS